MKRKRNKRVERMRRTRTAPREQSNWTLARYGLSGRRCALCLASLALGIMFAHWVPQGTFRSILLTVVVAFNVVNVLAWYFNWRVRRPKSMIDLLQQDAKQQAERLRVIESALVMQFEGPELAMEGVSADSHEETETSIEADTSSQQLLMQPLKALADGRTNYQHSTRALRIRRRVIM